MTNGSPASPQRATKDNGKGKVRGVGTVRVSDRFTLREVVLVSNLGFNLLCVSQLLDE